MGDPILQTPSTQLFGPLLSSSCHLFIFFLCQRFYCLDAIKGRASMKTAGQNPDDARNKGRLSCTLKSMPRNEIELCLSVKLRFSQYRINYKISDGAASSMP